MSESYWTDKRLSFKAKGILTYLLQNPNATPQDLIDSSKDKRTSVYSGLEELKNAGYFKRYAIRNAFGQYQNYQNEAHETKPGKAEEMKNQEGKPQKG